MLDQTDSVSRASSQSWPRHYHKRRHAGAPQQPTSKEADMAKSNPVEQETKAAPITVGNPAAAASLAIDQSHMEEFASMEEKSSIVECQRPPKGIFFTVRSETTKPWRDRGFYFLLQIEGRDPYLVAPDIANQKKDEDVIRPVLIVRYVTMAGEEGLWPLKLDQPDSKSNRWTTSALNILELAASGKWVRIVSAKNHYRHQASKRTFEEVPPRFSDRSFDDLINVAFKDRVIVSLDHEIWDELENGSKK
jgi:hypothetical protein